MYLTLDIVEIALEQLREFHPFFGQTFLVFKKGRLPVNRLIEFPVERDERNFFIKYYQPFADVDGFYRVMRANQPKKAWNSSKYPSSGSQSTRTKGNFAQALLHERGTNLWGWNKDYISILQKLLPNRKPIPTFFLAVWLYRGENWPEKTQPLNLVEKFVKDFKLNRFEAVLFSGDLPALIDSAELFQDSPITEEELRNILDPYNISENELTFDVESVLAFVQGNNFSHEMSPFSLNADWLSIIGFSPNEDSETAQTKQILMGILYHLKTGCNWDQIPKELASPTDCRLTFYYWLENGTWSLIWRNLFEQFEDSEKLSWMNSFLIGNFAPFVE
ncbi:MAG: transposase [Anaerolineae bacterium]|nr:transposase [Anaerolineae bacterium]